MNNSLTFIFNLNSHLLFKDHFIKIEEDNDDGSLSGAMSRDEKLVQEMNIPCSVEEIITKPMEEFNDLLSRHSVSEEVINVCRDIRRRGKNKVGTMKLTFWSGN